MEGSPTGYCFVTAEIRWKINWLYFDFCGSFTNFEGILSCFTCELIITLYSKSKGFEF